MTGLYFVTGARFGRLDDVEAGDAPTWSLEGSGAQCLAVDPGDPEVVYVGRRGGGVARTRDGGRTWKDVTLPEPDVFSVAVSRADGSVYAGTEPSRLFRSRDGGEAFEELTALQDIPSRPSWSFPPRPWTSHVRWIAPDPHDLARLLVGIELGGLMYTEDGGETFTDHRPGAQPDVHALAWHPQERGRAYQAAGGGAAWSFDGGLTWQAADQGRDVHYVWALAPDPDDPDRWFVTAAPGPGQAHGRGSAEAGIYRWERGGPWRRLTGGLPTPLTAMPYALAHGGPLPEGGRTLFAGFRDGRLFRSSDHGERWEELPSQAEAIVALAPVDR